MISFILIIVSAILTVTGITLLKTYRHLPLKELKRRARQDDNVAALLYRAAAYGVSLAALLWIIIVISAGSFFVLVTRTLPDFWALLASILLIWVGFVWLPASEVSSFGINIAKFLTPPLAWLASQVHPMMQRIYTFLRKHRPLTIHTGLYQKEDLVELIKKQHAQTDNRIADNELMIAYNALQFGDHLVRDILIPNRVVKSVNLHDAIGPVLMTELHSSGHSRFPVRDQETNGVAGMLYLRDLVNVKNGGSVKEHMRKDVYYVHEDQPLTGALQAFIKTKHHLFVVVNSFEEIVGIVTIEDVIEQIVGKPIMDEFDQYEDLRTVATELGKKDHEKQAKNHPVAGEVVHPTKKPEEVVESK